MAIGAFTAIFAASMALVANDIKRVMAYSTVSQLGYMMLALGVGARTAARVPPDQPRLLQGAAVPHGGERDPRPGKPGHALHGRAAAKMPITGGTMLIGGALAGRLPLPDQRLLEQGRDPGGGLGRGPVPGVRRGAGHRLPDGLLHVPRLVPGLLGRAAVGTERGHDAATVHAHAVASHQATGDTRSSAPGDHVHAAGGSLRSSRLGPMSRPG